MSIPSDIPPGNYTARAQRDGFATKEETGVVLQVNETATLYFTMKIGSVKEMVTVVAKPFGSGLHDVRVGNSGHDKTWNRPSSQRS